MVWVFDIGTILIMRRTGDDEAVLGRTAGVVILEDQPEPLPSV